MTYNIIAIALSILIPLYIALNKKENKKERYVIYIILVIGCIIRLINIQEIPNGLNADEASAGYEAYSILNWGIDRHGNKNPVFLVSWGSGQNVLYTYMMIPFIKLFGLSILSVRLPMALMSCITLIVLYELLKNNENKKLTILGIGFLAICPWHVMKSRWGLESNLFPDIALIAIYFINRFCDNKKSYNLYISSVFLGISAYAYGTSYFFLPFFEAIFLIYMLYKKYINLKQAVLFLVVTIIIVFPLIVCVIINIFDLPQINLGIITIPRLTVNRYQKISSIFSKNFLTQSINNFSKSIQILLYQYDNLGWNAQLFFGVTYIFSLPFTIIGIAKLIKTKDTILLNKIMNIWAIASMLLLFVCEPNINRINIIFYPIIYYTIFGIYEVIHQNKLIEKVIILIYCGAFFIFIRSYYKIDFNKYHVFEPSIEEVFDSIENIDEKKIYITDAIKEPYIYTLFYTKCDVREFIDTVNYATTTEEFNAVKSFNNYYFYIPQEWQEENAIYIIKKSEGKYYELEGYQIKEINGFLLIQKDEK